MSNNSQKRPSWREYFFAIAETVGTRATCPGANVGVIIIDPTSNRILATGYNGSAPGSPHCIDIGCIKNPAVNDGHCQRVIHAETNAIGHAARHGIALRGSHLYTSFVRRESKSYTLPNRYDGPLSDFPCLKCGQMIQAAGIMEAISKDGDSIKRFHNNAL